MSKDLERNPDYVGQGLQRLLFLFKDKPRIASLIKSYLAQVQELEDAAYSVWLLGQLQRIISGEVTPTDNIMDVLGRIVGQQREGFDNINFAILISARIASNRSRGKHADMIRVTKRLVPDAVVSVRTLPPASLLIVPSTPVGFDPYLIGESFLIPAVSAGVYLMFLWTTQPIANTLMLGYSRPVGATVPTIDQSPGWTGNGGTPIAGGLLGGLVAGER